MLSLRLPSLAFAALAALAVAPSAVAMPPSKEGLEFFEKNVRPILVDRCYECHSADKNSSKGGLILDSMDGAYKGGDEGPAVVPGNLEKSLLIKAVQYTDPEFSMPPKKTGGKLPDDKIAILEEWVKMGAPMPSGGAAKLTGLTGKARDHWAFQPVTKPTVPEVKNRAWVKTPIDAFVLAKLEEKGEEPALLLESVWSVEEAIGRFQGAVVVSLTPEDDGLLERLSALVERHKGKNQLYLQVEGSDGHVRRVRAGSQHKVAVSEGFAKELESLLGPGGRDWQESDTGVAGCARV